jgi:hypothetical protein
VLPWLRRRRRYGPSQFSTARPATNWKWRSAVSRARPRAGDGGDLHVERRERTPRRSWLHADAPDLRRGLGVVRPERQRIGEPQQPAEVLLPLSGGVDGVVQFAQPVTDRPNSSPPACACRTRDESDSAPAMTGLAWFGSSS